MRKRRYGCEGASVWLSLGLACLASMANASQPIAFHCILDNECSAGKTCAQTALPLTFKWSGRGWATLRERSFESAETATMKFDERVTVSMDADYTEAGVFAGGIPEGRRDSGEFWLLSYSGENVLLSVHQPKENLGLLFSGKCERTDS